MVDNLKLPDFLRSDSTDHLSVAAGAGISGGMAPPRISCRGKQFVLLDRDGNEIFDPQTGEIYLEQNGTTLDIVIVGALPHISKIYYTEGYDDNTRTAPACFSDNGTGPSDRARDPQSPTCAACKWNIWGSATNPATGKKRQACENKKKLAVVLVNDPRRTVYCLTLPGDSLTRYGEQMEIVRKRGAKVGGIIWQIGFDRDVTYPRILFKGLGYVPDKATYEQLAGIRPIRETWADDVSLALGNNDKAMAPDQVIARQAGALAAPAPKVVSKPLPSAYTPPPAEDGQPKAIGHAITQPPPEGAGAPGGLFANPPPPEAKPRGWPKGMPRDPEKRAAWEKKKASVPPAPRIQESENPAPRDIGMQEAPPDMADALTRALNLPT